MPRLVHDCHTPTLHDGAWGCEEASHVVERLRPALGPRVHYPLQALGLYVGAPWALSQTHLDSQSILSRKNGLPPWRGGHGCLNKPEKEQGCDCYTQLHNRSQR